MSRKDISDKDVVWSCWVAHNRLPSVSAFDRLVVTTRAPRKVVRAAMERASERGLIDYGVSLESAWPTDKGLGLLDAAVG